MGKDWSRARTETVSPFARDISCWVLLFAVICGFTAARPAAVPQGTPAALPSPILRRLSRPSASGAAPRSAWPGAAPAGRPQRAGGTAGRRWGGAARTCHVPCLSALGSLCRTEVSFTSGDYVGFGTQELHQPCAFTRPSVKSAHLPHSPG